MLISLYISTNKLHVKNQETFHNSLYIILIQAIPPSRAKRPNFNFFLSRKKSTYYASKKKLKSLPCTLKPEKAQFKVSLKTYLNTHFFYSYGKLLMFKNGSYHFHLHSQHLHIISIVYIYTYIYISHYQLYILDI
jgi:hypothetical protein